MDRLILIRHGEASAGEETDPGLSSAGIAQVERLGEVLSTSDASAVLHGPRRRTRETAELIGTKLDLRTVPSDLLDDRTPYPSEDRAGDYTSRQWEYLRAVPPSERDVNGGAMAAAWRELLAADYAGTVIAVTHAFVVGSFVSTVLGAAPNAWMKLQMRNAGITELHVSASGDWVIDRVNEG